MPIEDVHFLLRNSVRDSALLFVDSAQRDRRKHPTPSEYSVDLDETVQQVYGVDILDASIPSTMYNVDRHNNRARFLRVSVGASERALPSVPVPAGASSGDAAHNDAIEAAHTDALGLHMTALGLASPLRDGWLADPLGGTYSVVVGEWDEPNVVGGRPKPAALDGVEPDASAAPGGAVGATRHRLLRQRTYGPLRVWRVGSAPDGTVVPPDVRTRAVRTPDGQLYLLDAGTGPSASVALAALDALELARDAPLRRCALIPATASYASAPDGSEQRVLYIYDTYAVPDAAALASASEALSVTSGRVLTFAVATVDLPVGNYPSLSELHGALEDALGSNAALGGAGAVAVTTTTGRAVASDTRGTFRLRTASDFRLLFSGQHSSARTTLGMDLDADAQERGGAGAGGTPLTRASRTHASIPLGGQAAPLHCSVLRDDGTQTLDTPGLVSLAGARYITLRCPEIENHMSAVNRNGRAGIGVFKLMNANEIAQLRFDYVNLVRKPFHPIARVSRLHLRFELGDGSLYDFKGINHQILLTLKYYAAPAHTEGDGLLARAAAADAAGGMQTPYVLNPNYDPNFVEYMTRREDMRRYGGSSGGSDGGSDGGYGGYGGSDDETGSGSDGA